MKNSDIIQTIMFDYKSITRERIIELCQNLPGKIIRWLGAHHPDNKTRKIFFEITNVVVGENTIINSNLIISDGYKPMLKIGKRVALSPNVLVICESGPNNSFLQKIEYVKENLICNKEVTIGDDAWVGAGVIILPGVNIGEKSIIGANSVVTKDVPSNSVVAGVPAKIIRYLQ